MGLLILFFSLAIGVSFLCSMLEASLLSVTPTFIATEEEKGKPYAASLRKLKEKIDRPLAAILSYNTIAHTVGAAGVGAQAGIVFGDQYFAVISGVMTIAILILSEIIPKSIGANYWRIIAPISAPVLNFMIYSIYPLVIISEFMTKIFNAEKGQTTSREEVAALTNIGYKEGIFEESESKIINNLIRFKSIRVKDVMTPRTVVLIADEELSLREFFEDKRYMKFSRIPVFNESIDNITGYVLKYDVLEKLAEDQFDIQLKDIKRSILINYENFPIPSAFEILMDKKEHISLVVDEYGGTSGIVTLEDILETLLGLEIQDELDGERDMQQLARKQWQQRAKSMGLFFPHQNENLD